MRMCVLKGHDYSGAASMVIIFGSVEAISIFMFIFNIWKSLDTKEKKVGDANGMGTRSRKGT